MSDRDEVMHELGEIKGLVTATREELSAHTRQDAGNFEAIHEDLTELKVSAGIAQAAGARSGRRSGSWWGSAAGAFVVAAVEIWRSLTG